MNPLISSGTLIIHVLFDTYIVILLLRLLLQKLGASWRNPLSQFVIKLTEDPLKPLRKIIPGFKGFDFAIVFLALLLQCIEIMLLWHLQFGVTANVQGTLIVACGEILSKFIYIYIYSIIINAVASWIPQLQTHPLAHIVFLITDPILSLARRFIPPIGGIDISPMAVLLLLALINTLIITPILDIGARIILG
jgi:YggT family protein